MVIKAVEHHWDLLLVIQQAIIHKESGAFCACNRAKVDSYAARKLEVTSWSLEIGSKEEMQEEGIDLKNSLTLVLQWYFFLKRTLQLGGGKWPPRCISGSVPPRAKIPKAIPMFSG